MLKELRIRNFAVVEDVRLTFKEGLNVLTGSTGAGKSLILSAVNLLRGHRANTQIIRKGKQKAVVEAVFRVDERLRGGASGISDVGSSILLRRELLASGKSEAFVNDKVVPIKMLSEVSSQLIEPHGQNEQLRLKSPENHVAYIDMFAGTDTLISTYKDLYERYSSASENLRLFDKNILLAREKRELLQHRIEELDRADLAKGERASLEEKLMVLENSQNILQALNSIIELLYEGDISAVGNIAQGKNAIAGLIGVDKRFAEYVSRLEESQVVLEECARDMQAYLDRIEFDPEQLEVVQERLAYIQSLERRYGKALDNILDDRDKWRSELEAVDEATERRDHLEREVGEIAENLEAAGLKLSEKRKKEAKRFDARICMILEKMMMPGVEFETRFSMDVDDNSPIVVDGGHVRMHADGLDRVEFYVRTNRGEKAGRLSEIASTGETSRIALAIKDILNREKKGSVIIFDELDAGVGGDMGGAIAEKLLSLSRNYQIVAITHLPQIAASAGHHLIVQKRISNHRTFVSVSEIQGEERRKEIARMLGGSRGSEKRLALAAEMLAAKEQSAVRP